MSSESPSYPADAGSDTFLLTVREGQRAGAFRSDADPDAFARGFAAAADGLATHVVLHRGVVSPDDMRAACAALVDALAA